MEGSSRAGQLTVWEGDTGKENVGQGVRSEKRKRGSSSYTGVSFLSIELEQVRVIRAERFVKQRRPGVSVEADLVEGSAQLGQKVRIP